MIKIHYDENTGEILNRYDLNLNYPKGFLEPNIDVEICKFDNSEIIDLNTLKLREKTEEELNPRKTKLEQFQKDIQYQHDAFNEYSREIIYQIQYNTALGNTTLVTNLQNQLQAEQQAVIARINDITEAYNENN